MAADSRLTLTFKDPFTDPNSKVERLQRNADRSGRAAAKSRERLARDGHPADVPTANGTYAPFP
jgi:hypothetical protein